MQTQSSRAISEEKQQVIKYLAEFAVRPMFRTPLFVKPEEWGIEDYEEVYFPSADGVPLEGWWMKAENSNKLIIANHPMPMSRAGFCGHLGEPWSSVDNIKIDFVKIWAHLVKAGYHVLAYDLRNHGTSGSANGGICGIGRYEWRDCIGAKQFVDSHPQLSQMTVGLYSQCTGANAQFEAIDKQPELFDNIQCMFAPLPVSMEALMGSFAKLQGVGDYMDEMDFEQIKFGGLTNEEMNPQHFASAVTMPVFMLQVKDDAWTDNPRDGQATFDLLSSQDKELFWLEGTTRRFDGYNYFAEHPKQMLDWFARYMK
ncbi:alpha/beta hydrolase family protein [Vibrio sp. WXL103]|uniref:alpha/beta hydrolase family protein n=1 Tax=Vibrio sp. WXL103 TaxID=3450710 RepID=UPI003EC7B0F0